MRTGTCIDPRKIIVIRTHQTTAGQRSQYLVGSCLSFLGSSMCMFSLLAHSHSAKIEAILSLPLCHTHHSPAPALAARIFNDFFATKTTSSDVQHPMVLSGTVAPRSKQEPYTETRYGVAFANHRSLVCITTVHCKNLTLTCRNTQALQ